MTIVNDILKQMTAVGQPQRKFLETLFATILALRGRVNFRNLNRYCEYSERTIARQFRRLFDWPAFHQRVMPAALDPCSEIISVQDASFIPKSGKETFGLGHFFNGCAGRAERGLEISTLAVVDVTRRCAFTLAVAQTPPGKGGTQAEEEETRIDFYKQQLRAQRQRLPKSVKYHAVDGYFAKQKYIDEVVDLKLHPITKLRCDADCLFLYTGPHPHRRRPRIRMTRFFVVFFLGLLSLFGAQDPVQWTLTLAQKAAAPGSHVLGKFKNLLMATAKSPAMLFYLDNFQSTAVNGINSPTCPCNAAKRKPLVKAAPQNPIRS